MGVWRDLTIEGSFLVSDGYFTLPEEAEAVLYANYNNQPARTRGLWHDYKAVGSNYDSTLNFGLVDDGFNPLLVDLPTAGVTTLYAVPSASSTDATAINFGNGEDVRVVGLKADYSKNLFAATGSNTLVAPTTATKIESVSYTGLLHKYDLQYLVSAGVYQTIATVGPGDGVCRFRRYRLPQATDGAYAHVLCKRSFLPVQNDNDIVYINHIPSLKHGLLAIVAEDNADLDRAEVHWKKCRDLLDEQLDQYRGPARPSLDLQLSGEGITGIRNFY